MIGLLYMFYALALVCDHYFVPTLDVIIERWVVQKILNLLTPSKVGHQ